MRTRFAFLLAVAAVSALALTGSYDVGTGARRLSLNTRSYHDETEQLMLMPWTALGLLACVIFWSCYVCEPSGQCCCIFLKGLLLALVLSISLIFAVNVNILFGWTVLGLLACAILRISYYGGPSDTSSDTDRSILKGLLVLVVLLSLVFCSLILMLLLTSYQWGESYGADLAYAGFFLLWAACFSLLFALRHRLPISREAPPCLIALGNVVHILAVAGAVTLAGRCLYMASWDDDVASWDNLVRDGRAFETKLSIWLVAPVSLACLAIPLIYMLATRHPFLLTVEVVVSAADFSSDLLNALTNEFYSQLLFLMCLATAIGAGTVIVLTHYGVDIAARMSSTFLFVAMPAWRRLADHGIHQVFEVAGDSFEMHFVNYVTVALLTTSLPLIWLFFAPLAALSHGMGLFMLGMFLQSTRLLLLKPTEDWYQSVLGRMQESPSREATQGATEDQSPVDKAKYHQMMCTEIATEGLPSAAVTLINYNLMRNNDMTEQMNWVAAVSLFFSAYMVIRIGFKYSWHFAHGTAWSDIPLPFDEKALSYKELQAKDLGMKAGEAGIAVGSTTAQAARVLLQ